MVTERECFWFGPSIDSGDPKRVLLVRPSIDSGDPKSAFGSVPQLTVVTERECFWFGPSIDSGDPKRVLLVRSLN